MHPRTLLILLVLLFGGAFALRFLVIRFALLPVTQEAVLRRATSLSVTYNSPQGYQTQVISDPRELKPLLAAIRVEQDDYYYSFGSGGRGANLTFHFPSGQQPLTLESSDKLGSYKVDRAFYDQLNKILSERAGHPVDVLYDQPFGNFPRRNKGNN